MFRCSWLMTCGSAGGWWKEISFPKKTISLGIRPDSLIERRIVQLEHYVRKVSYGRCGYFVDIWFIFRYTPTNEGYIPPRGMYVITNGGENSWSLCNHRLLISWKGASHSDGVWHHGTLSQQSAATYPELPGWVPSAIIEPANDRIIGSLNKLL